MKMRKVEITWEEEGMPARHSEHNYHFKRRHDHHDANEECQGARNVKFS